MRVFFSRNAFEIPHHKPYSYTAEAKAAPERCAAAVFLAEVVPADMIPHLSKLTISLWHCVKTTAREDWCQIVSYVAGISNLRFLSIGPAMGFDEIKYAIPDTPEELASERGLVQIRDAINQYAWPIEISETAIQSFYVDIGFTQYPPIFKVFYSYRRAEDSAVLVGDERIAGDNYAFVRGCEGPVGEQGGKERWLEGLDLFELEDYGVARCMADSRLPKRLVGQEIQSKQ
ncbi:hypothetical protein N7457_003946 [Penicillium paradoxum]|uniref:uncharacterized protein n=1 Tax=Penicillium paradoxum TaxID=176176 RepID=UPI002548E346|nr:uncharacterized protein N7457_003946 [Penicillium paradoxum]KAJ5782172.1 hypothetical protein N7457_003946 [Penicillium paradoxum]